MTRGSNAGQHSFEVSIYLIIGDSQNAQVSRCKNLIAFCIVVTLLTMDLAVQFYHELSSVAVEIDDETVDDLLASKVKPFEPIRP